MSRLMVILVVLFSMLCLVALADGSTPVAIVPGGEPATSDQGQNQIDEDKSLNQEITLDTAIDIFVGSISDEIGISEKLLIERMGDAIDQETYEASKEWEETTDVYVKAWKNAGEDVGQVIVKNSELVLTALKKIDNQTPLYIEFESRQIGPGEPNQLFIDVGLVYLKRRREARQSDGEDEKVDKYEKVNFDYGLRFSGLKAPAIRWEWEVINGYGRKQPLEYDFIFDPGDEEIEFGIKRKNTPQGIDANLAFNYMDPAFEARWRTRISEDVWFRASGDYGFNDQDYQVTASFEGRFDTFPNLFKSLFSGLRQSPQRVKNVFVAAND